MTNKEKFLAGHRFRIDRDWTTEYYVYERPSKDTRGIISIGYDDSEDAERWYSNVMQMTSDRVFVVLFPFGKILSIDLKFSDLIFLDDDK